MTLITMMMSQCCDFDINDDDEDKYDDAKSPDEEVADIGDGIPVPELSGSFFARDRAETMMMMTMMRTDGAKTWMIRMRTSWRPFQPLDIVS